MAQNTLAPWAELVPGVGGVMTADELLAVQDDAWQYELVDGRLVRMSPTSLEHYDIWIRLFRALDRFVEDHRLGIVTPADTGFKLSRVGQPDTVLSPDLAVVGAENVQRLPAPGTPERKKYLSLAPDLAIEIASPDQHRPEMAQKAQIYLESAVRLVWIVWPVAQQVDVWRAGAQAPLTTLGANESLDGQDILPGFSLSIAHLFSR